MATGEQLLSRQGIRIDPAAGVIVLGDDGAFPLDGFAGTSMVWRWSDPVPFLPRTQHARVTVEVSLPGRHVHHVFRIRGGDAAARAKALCVEIERQVAAARGGPDAAT